MLILKFKLRLSLLGLLLVMLFFSFGSFAASKSLKLHFIDVGQADCILAQFPNGSNLLIDAGNREDASLITSYLLKQKVKKINVLVATHPHEDHIGGMAAVVSNFEIGQIYMPKVSNTTTTFKQLLLAIKAKNLKVTSAKAGVKLTLDSKIQCQMLAPNSVKYEDLNDYSPVFKLNYGKNSFLFTGDAARESEKEMLELGMDLKVDLLKIGHHGSNTSTTEKFLAAAAPVYAVISVGKDNDYGHPGSYTMKRLQKAGIKIYRTDQQGTIIAVSDGKSIKITTEK